MKVTVMSAAVYKAAYGEPTPEGLPWAISTPDGLYFVGDFDHARDFAYSYGLPVSFL